MRRVFKNPLILLPLGLLLLCTIALFASAYHYMATHPVVGKMGANSLSYNGKLYYVVQTGEDCILKYVRGRYLGEIENGDPIYAIENDREGYICQSSWDGLCLFADKEVQLSKGEKITSVYLEDGIPPAIKRVTNEKDCQSIMSLETIKGEDESYSSSKTGVKNVSLYGCFDGSAIATEWIGSLAVKDQKWIFVSERNLKYSVESSIYEGVVINDQKLIGELKRITSGIDDYQDELR